MIGVLVLSASASISSAENCSSVSGLITVPEEIVTVVNATGMVLGMGEDSRVRILKPNEFPFVGRFRGPGETPSSCTGTLLQDDIVLGVGHCVRDLGESPLFILSRDPYATRGAAATILLEKGDDWAIYRLKSVIEYKGSYPRLRAMNADELKYKRLMSVGFPVEGNDALVGEFVIDENCKVINTTFVEQKFLSNCFTRKGMSGGPLGFFENDEFSIVGIRQGPQWGNLRKLFDQVGTVETPVIKFKNRYDELVKRPQRDQ